MKKNLLIGTSLVASFVLSTLDARYLSTTDLEMKESSLRSDAFVICEKELNFELSNVGSHPLSDSGEKLVDKLLGTQKGLEIIAKCLPISGTEDRTEETIRNILQGLKPEEMKAKIKEISLSISREKTLASNVESYRSNVVKLIKGKNQATTPSAPVHTSVEPGNEQEAGDSTSEENITPENGVTPSNQQGLGEGNHAEGQTGGAVQQRQSGADNVANTSGTGSNSELPATPAPVNVQQQSGAPVQQRQGGSGAPMPPAATAAPQEGQQQAGAGTQSVPPAATAAPVGTDNSANTSGTGSQPEAGAHNSDAQAGAGSGAHVQQGQSGSGAASTDDSQSESSSDSEAQAGAGSGAHVQQGQSGSGAASTDDSQSESSSDSEAQAGAGSGAPAPVGLTVDQSTGPNVVAATIHPNNPTSTQHVDSANSGTQNRRPISLIPPSATLAPQHGQQQGGAGTLSAEDELSDDEKAAKKLQDEMKRQMEEMDNI